MRLGSRTSVRWLTGVARARRERAPTVRAPTVRARAVRARAVLTRVALGVALTASVACAAPPGQPSGAAGTVGGASGPAGTGASAAASACALPAGGPGLPTGWPRLPLLPEDAVPTSVQARSGERTVVEGVVPRPFAQVLAGQRTSYERAGLVLDHGEVEPRDAESDFHGRGLLGRWALREVPGCPGHTSVSVVLKPAG